MLTILKTLFRLILVVIFLEYFMCSCTCTWHLDKAKEKCGYTLTHDTLTVRDTILIPSLQTDTLFKYFQRDTVIVREGGMIIKYFYNTKDSTVYLKGSVETRTVPVEIKVPVETTTFQYQWIDGLKWPLVVIVAILILAFLMRRHSGGPSVNINQNDSKK